MAKRLQVMGAPGYDNGFQLSLMEDRLEQSLCRHKPTIYFVNSMPDLLKAEWVENIHHQCKYSGIAFFFKQWGGWGADGKRRAKKANGRTFNGRTWNEMLSLPF